MKLYLASGNPHKAHEMNLLASEEKLGLEIVSAREVGGMPVVVEDTGTFVGNARKKARALCAKLTGGAWVLADDSGICVDALQGAPGVESAYFAGPQADDEANLQKLIDVMRDVPDGKREAHYICVLVLCGPEGAEYVFAGRREGTLLRGPRGHGGFGYDPLFVPDGERLSYGELDETVKNHGSHRARAWRQFARWWRSMRIAHEKS